MHKGFLQHLQLALSAQTHSPFTTMPALFPVALAALWPYLSFSGYTGISVPASKQLKKDSLRLYREKGTCLSLKKLAYAF